MEGKKEGHRGRKGEHYGSKGRDWGEQGVNNTEVVVTEQGWRQKEVTGRISSHCVRPYSELNYAEPLTQTKHARNTFYLFHTETNCGLHWQTHPHICQLICQTWTDKFWALMKLSDLARWWILGLGDSCGHAKLEHNHIFNANLQVHDSAFLSCWTDMTETKTLDTCNTNSKIFFFPITGVSTIEL